MGRPNSRKPSTGQWVSGISGTSREPLGIPVLSSETERVGFEPTEGFPSNDFESFAFDHSATSPGPSADWHLTERSAPRSPHWPASLAAGGSGWSRSTEPHLPRPVDQQDAMVGGPGAEPQPDGLRRRPRGRPCGWRRLARPPAGQRLPIGQQQPALVAQLQAQGVAVHGQGLHRQPPARQPLPRRQGDRPIAIGHHPRRLAAPAGRIGARHRIEQQGPIKAGHPQTLGQLAGLAATETIGAAADQGGTAAVAGQQQITAGPPPPGAPAAAGRRPAAPGAAPAPRGRGRPPIAASAGPGPAAPGPATPA